LSLPPRCYSDLLRDWAEYCISDESYGESIRVLERILGLSLSMQALETGVREDAGDVEAFYAWVREQLLHMLSGKTATVIETLQALTQDPSLSSTQCQMLHTTIGYYQRNLPYMRYDQYLAQGWPIGTGVVEGACDHLIKDRFEQSGMRWTPSGAQPPLDLRAVRLNDDWDAYHDFRRRRQHRRLYGSQGTVSPGTESIVLKMAA